jgi:hypothetical protein
MDAIERNLDFSNSCALVNGTFWMGPAASLISTDADLNRIYDVLLAA